MYIQPHFYQSMRIEHLAIWVNDLEASKDFYTKYFNLKANERYESKRHPFISYFLSFENETETRIELMQKPDIEKNNSRDRGLVHGFAHIAISIGSKEKVDALTERLRADGYKIAGEPRTTGDGYYESIIEDNDGNWIELTS